MDYEIGIRLERIEYKLDAIIEHLKKEDKKKVDKEEL